VDEGEQRGHVVLAGGGEDGARGAEDGAVEEAEAREGHADRHQPAPPAHHHLCSGVSVSERRKTLVNE